jgi:hypothetical protein
LVAVAGAQAADLPVKAKPVEYVKVCSLYGAGYYYMPGTDICLKLGGYIRYQATWNPGSSITSGPMSNTGVRNTRLDSDDFGQRVRALITVDTRQQTQYGVLRTYILLGYSQDTAGAAGAETTSPAVYMTRGFIQVAGFTLGKATSFFDIYPNASFGYNVGSMYVPDTGDAGQIVAAYTAQFGNGVSATIAIEQSRRAPVTFVGPGTGGTNSFVLGSAASQNSLGGVAAGVSGLPDVVGNLRIDQAWGSLLAAVAWHDTSGGYYGTSETTGHPSNNSGWAATVGGIINLPFIAPGDRFAFQFVYTEGAVRYAALNHPTSGMLSFNGTTVGFGWATDGVFAGPAGAVQNTTSWSLAAAVEHLWTPALRTSLYGSYWDVSYNATAKAGICANVANTAISGVTNAINPSGIPWGGTGCNPDFNSWVIGSRTQWEPVKGWIMGVDVLYLKLHSANTASGLLTPLQASGAKPVQTYTVSDQSAWVFTFRTQRDYHP